MPQITNHSSSQTSGGNNFWDEEGRAIWSQIESESTACGEGLVVRLHVAKVAASRFVLLVMVIQIFKYLL